MFAEPVFVCGIGFLLFGVLLMYFLSRPAKFPPGPLRLPIVGSIPFINLPIQEGLFELFGKYGPIFSVYFGNYPVVVLCDLVLIREAFKNEAFCGRPWLRPVSDLTYLNGKLPLGVGFNEGQHWQEQRRFALRALRDFGFSKSSMEGKMMDEIHELVQGFKKDAGQAVETGERFNIATLNILLHIVTGVRYPHDDPKLKKILFNYLDVLENDKSHGVFLFMPWLTKIAPTLSGYKKSMAKTVPFMQFIRNEVEEHKKTWKYEKPRDFIDAYLNQIEDTKDSSSSFYKDVGEKSLVVTILDFMTGGGDTTGTTLTWGILYACQFSSLNPEVQKKVQDEIDAVVGMSRLPSLADRPKMDFMEAFISETLRMSSITPIGIFHNTTETSELYGFTIPKNTVLIANLWQIHHDRRYWRDPNVFRPDRFINLEGKYVKPETVIPFSMGKRICPGEALARDQLLLFFGAIFQQFRVGVDPTQPPNAAMEASHGIISKPKSFKVLVELRNPKVGTIEQELE